jgi:type IV secretory pathway component VirB8
MTFVFAGAAALALVLALAVVRLMPIQKAQIFFLTTTPYDNLEITLRSFSVDDQNIGLFKENFAKEYVTARNEIFPNTAGMQRKWRRDYGGQVFSWSSPAVYDAFARTHAASAMLPELSGFEFLIRCSVNFKGGVQPRSENKSLGRSKYGVAFTYSCAKDSGQVWSKDYTIGLTLEMEPKIKWEERLRNPLGIKVIEYIVESGGSDPLDSDWEML